MNKRWLIWLPLLGIAAWLVASAPSDDEGAADEVVDIAAALSHADVATAASSKRKQETIQLERLIPRNELFPERQSKHRRDLFASVSWLPPVVHVAAVPAPELPPPPAFSYVGKQFDGKDWEVFLSLADRTYIARAGAVLSDNYKIERLDASTVIVVDLRTSQSQTISIGEAP